ncbi:unnamed protein product [Trichogramma brassicae]|uniref:C2H2-type domain-containing protein n=1 Tax=Trichogramma brassicae TaxID=86971 RepID=A0A6H5IWA1_9HYME|nr:unnamed protein product [Trichogramma brassicae]
MPNIGGPRCSRRRLYTALLTRSSCVRSPNMERGYRNTQLCSARQKQFIIGAPASVRYAASAAFPPRRCMFLADTPHHWSSSLTNARGSTSVVARMPEVGPLVMSAPRRWRSGKPSGPATTKGRWTHRLIPSIAAWIERRHGEVNYHLTQLLSGHGCFRSYLCRTKNDTSSSCPTCHPTVEDVEHVIFHCPPIHVGKRRALPPSKRAIRARDNCKLMDLAMMLFRKRVFFFIKILLWVSINALTDSIKDSRFLSYHYGNTNENQAQPSTSVGPSTSAPNKYLFGLATIIPRVISPLTLTVSILPSSMNSNNTHGIVTITNLSELSVRAFIDTHSKILLKKTPDFLESIIAKSISLPSATSNRTWVIVSYTLEYDTLGKITCLPGEHRY